MHEHAHRSKGSGSATSCTDMGEHGLPHMPVEVGSDGVPHMPVEIGSDGVPHLPLPTCQ